MNFNLEPFFRPKAICLVGRPNVGKSTLFNRLTKTHLSLVHEKAGSTRDRIYKDVDFEGNPAILVDTAGLERIKNPDVLQKSIQKHTEEALEEADILFFLVDAQQGLTPMDLEIAQTLRFHQKEVFVLINKCESQKAKDTVFEFYKMGFEQVFPISAAHGHGIEDLLEQVKPLLLPPEGYEPPKENPDEIPIAIVGRPNVGKSSFINKLLSEERHLVSDVAGTTVDSVDSILEYHGKHFRLMDTAGIRRKRSIYEDIEKMAVSRSLGAMDKAKVVLFLMDAEEGLTEQDKKVAAFAHDKGKGIVILVNKWDLAKTKGENGEKFIQSLREEMPFLAYVPIKLISAKTGLRVFDALDLALEVYEESHKRVGTGELNRLIERMLVLHQPPVVSGRRVKIYYGTQVSVAPPTFLFMSNRPKDIHFSYKRFLTNRIREALGFKGVPIHLIFRGKDKKDA